MRLPAATAAPAASTGCAASVNTAEAAAPMTTTHALEAALAMLPHFRAAMPKTFKRIDPRLFEMLWTGGPDLSALLKSRRSRPFRPSPLFKSWTAWPSFRHYLARSPSRPHHRRRPSPFRRKTPEGTPGFHARPWYLSELTGRGGVTISHASAMDRIVLPDLDSTMHPGDPDSPDHKCLIKVDKEPVTMPEKPAPEVYGANENRGAPEKTHSNYKVRPPEPWG